MSRAAAILTMFLVAASGCFSRAGDAAPTPTPAPTVPVPAAIDKYAYRGTECMELGLDVPVAAANVRPFVANKYKLVGEAQGRATMAIEYARCDRMVLPNVTGAIQVFQVDVAVMIEDPGGRPGATASYEVAFLTTNEQMAADAARTSLPAQPMPKSSLLAFPVQTLDLVQAHVNAGNFTMDVDATATRAPAAGPAGGTYYSTGANGTARMVYDVTLSSVGPARGTIRAPTGTTMAKIFGAGSVEGAGFFATFSLGANLTRLPA